MDYILLSTLSSNSGLHVKELMLTYDIACQWSRRFFGRISNYPSKLHVNTDNVDVIFGIPKFHLPGHGRSCQFKYSLNYIPGSGRTDGEGIEREWSQINQASMSTREMAPGQRHEVLNDMWGAWNWRKITRLGYISCSF
jgi:hypothetical protein